MRSTIPTTDKTPMPTFCGIKSSTFLKIMFVLTAIVGVLKMSIPHLFVIVAGISQAFFGAFGVLSVQKRHYYSSIAVLLFYALFSILSVIGFIIYIAQGFFSIPISTILYLLTLYPLFKYILWLKELKKIEEDDNLLNE